MARALLLSVVILGVGCAQETGASEPVVARLQECGFATPGELRRLPRELYVPDSCYEACVAEASCEELQETLCGDSITLARRCDERCAYRCPGGELIRADQECDRVEDCSDGSDELGCSVNPGEGCTGRRCDGVSDCRDGSDEIDCGSFFCGEREFAHTERCNGIERCPAGEDEVGCARVVLACMP